jgi:CheY-like chemotaxis protein
MGTCWYLPRFGPQPVVLPAEHPPTPHAPNEPDHNNTGAPEANTENAVGTVRPHHWKAGSPGLVPTEATTMVRPQNVTRLYSSLGLEVVVVDDSRTQRPRPHVLLVDDSAVQRTAAAGVLRKIGFRVTCVNDGLEAVVALQKRDFAVVLMDVEMPVMDGLAATVEIRQREALLYTYTPIIAFTSTTDRDRCFAAGMDGFAGKPLKSADLELIFKILSQVRLRPDARPA